MKTQLSLVIWLLLAPSLGHAQDRVEFNLAIERLALWSENTTIEVIDFSQDLYYKTRAAKNYLQDVNDLLNSNPLGLRKSTRSKIIRKLKSAYGIFTEISENRRLYELALKKYQKDFQAQIAETDELIFKYERKKESFSAQIARLESDETPNPKRQSDLQALRKRSIIATELSATLESFHELLEKHSDTYTESEGKIDLIIHEICNSAKVTKDLIELFELESKVNKVKSDFVNLVKTVDQIEEIKRLEEKIVQSSKKLKDKARAIIM